MALIANEPGVSASGLGFIPAPAPGPPVGPLLNPKLPAPRRGLPAFVSHPASATYAGDAKAARLCDIPSRRLRPHFAASCPSDAGVPADRRNIRLNSVTSFSQPSCVTDSRFRIGVRFAGISPRFSCRSARPVQQLPILGKRHRQAPLVRGPCGRCRVQALRRRKRERTQPLRRRSRALAYTGPHAVCCCPGGASA